MSPAIRQGDMDKARCASAGCENGSPHKHPGPLFLHGRCHESSGSFVSYFEGLLTIACAKCKKLIAQVEVAT